MACLKCRNTLEMCITRGFTTEHCNQDHALGKRLYYKEESKTVESKLYYCPILILKNR